MIIMIEKKKIKMIRVNASLFAARNGYNYIRKDEFDDWVENGCAEGHNIKTGYVFANDAGEEITLGGTCQHKYMIFKLWQNLDETMITDDLISIGEKFWLIERDGLWDIVFEIIKQKKIDIDFKRIPPPEEIEAYREQIKSLHSQAIAIYKAREKEAAKQLELSKTSLAYMADKDYASIASISLPWKKGLDATRKDLLQKFGKYGWNDKQRGLVRYIAGEYKRHNACQESGEDIEKISIVVNLAQAINKETTNTFEKDFTESIIRARACLTDKQIPIAVRIILQYAEKKGMKLPFNMKDFLVKIKRK